MNCRTARKLMTELFDKSPVELPELMEHLAACPDCSRAYKQARQTIDLLKPKLSVCASPDFKERVMKNLADLEAKSLQKEETRRSRKKIWIPAIAAAAAALFLIGAPYLNQFGKQGENGSLQLAQALAAEKNILDQGGIVHFVKEVFFHPVSDSMRAKTRMHLLTQIGAGGEMLFDQLTLPDSAARGFTVHEDSWFDPSSKRFALIVRVDGKPVFVNSFDGEIVRTTEAAADGWLKIVEKSISGPFTWPEELNESIGATGDIEKMLEGFDEEHISEAGEGTLEDGTPVRLVKAEIVGGDGKVINSSLIKVRKEDNTFAEMDFYIREQNVSSTRFSYNMSVAESSVPWSLEEIKSLVQVPGASVQFNVMKPDISVRQMLDKVDFPAYLIQPEPSWTVERKVSVISYNDPVLKRKISECIVVCRAKNDRHVVLAQSNMFFEVFGSITRDGEIIYTSPQGFEVWSTHRDQWLAKISIRAARGVIPYIGRPADDCTGYTIITPDRPVVMLAVNGALSDDELHELVDNLLLVDEYFGRQALESGVIDFSGESGRLALIAAVGLGLDDKVKELLDAGVDPNSFNPNSKMHPLWLACARGRIEMVKALIAAGAIVSSKEPFGNIPLFRAVDTGNEEIVRLLLDAGADVNALNRNDLTSLFFAAGRGDSAMVSVLLKAGAEPEAANEEGRTPLMFAARNGCSDIVKALINAGTTVDARDHDGRNALYLAAVNGDSSTVEVLIKAGADLEATNKDGVNSLMITAKSGNAGAVNALIAAGANVNTMDKDGKPLLMHTMDLNEYVEVVRLLITAGADVNAALPDGWTVLQHAKDKGHMEIVALLKEAGAKE